MKSINLTQSKLKELSIKEIAQIEGGQEDVPFPFKIVRGFPWPYIVIQ